MSQKIYYKINKESATFRRLQLTNLGWTDTAIQEIHAFKKGDDRYLRIAFNKKPESKLLKEIDRRVVNMGDLKQTKEDLEDLFQACLDRKEDKTYLLYFDRDTYV